MNDPIRKNLLIILSLMFIFSLNISFAAAESCSLNISVVIPEIPGVNVPLLQEETIQTKTQIPAAEQNTQNLTETDENESPEIIQQDEEKQIMFAEGNSVVILKTLYCR